jgi:uncharacterized protein
MRTPNLLVLASYLLGAFILPVCPAWMTAQSHSVATVDGTRRHTIQSRVLGETRIVDITTPRGYDANPSARYPVVVTLDGEFEGEVAAAIARFYGGVGMLPGVIVVSVHNTARTRDLTPPAIPPFAPPPGASGGADRFLSYLANEALPLVHRTYRTAPMRVLIGHSLGGLFALHAIASRPELFTGYVIMEPATWWNDQAPVRAARAALALPNARRARVMLVNAPSLSADTSSWGGDRPMVRHVRVGEETHQSMAAAGIAAGLRRLFEDFRPPRWRPGSSPVEMLARYDSLAARIGYEVPVPAATYATIVRMALDARYFDDAGRALTRMEHALGVSDETREYRSRLDRERREPVPPGFVPLVIPAARPTATQAARFVGRWRSVDAREPHEVEIRASGDTIIIHDRVTFAEGEPFEADDPVIQVTNEGVLEWGLPFFQGLAALVVLKATLTDDSTMVVRREARGWLPRDPHFDARSVVRLTRIVGNARPE